MFAVNPGKQPKCSEVYQWWASRPEGKLLIEFLSSLGKITPSLGETAIENIQFPSCGPVEDINPHHAADDRFMDANNELLFTFDIPEIEDLSDRREIRGLPTDFVGSLLLNRIFSGDWGSVDANNNLTGLDYLGNLEWNRCGTLREAAQTLDVTSHNWDEVLKGSPDAWAWVKSIQDRERVTEMLYSSLWVDLRLWSMVKVLQSEPFYKPSVIAMLNTLFPPVITGLPSNRVTKEIMWYYRSLMYRYIVSVEADGKSVVDGLMQKLNHSASSRPWPMVHKNLAEYIKLADVTIKQAAAVRDGVYFSNLHQHHTIPRPSRISQATLAPELADNLSREVSSNSTYDGLEHKQSKPQTQVVPARHKISGRFKDPMYRGRNLGGLSLSGSPQDGRVPNNEPNPLRPKFSEKNITSQIDSTQLLRTSQHSATSQATPEPEASRPGSFAFEHPRYTGRQSSAAVRKSYDFRTSSCYTPEPPASPPAPAKKEGVKLSRMFQRSHPSDDRERFIKTSEPLLPTTKPKGSIFDMFRRKKKATTAPNVVGLGFEDPPEEPEPYGSFDIRDFKVKSRQQKMQPPSAEPQTLKNKSIFADEPRLLNTKTNFAADEHSLKEQSSFVAEPRTVKTKPSFSILRGRQNRETGRVASEGDAQMPSTYLGIRSRPKLGAKASFSSLFAAKAAQKDKYPRDGDDSEKSDMNTGEELEIRFKTIRKACSYGSVGSFGLGKKDKNAARPGSAAGAHEDMVFTSADITEPFPFGLSFHPKTPASLTQTPALLLEKSKDFGYMESQRQDLIETARSQSKEKWEQNDDFRRRLRVAQKKRQEKRAEIDLDAQLRQDPNWKLADVGDGENQKVGQTPRGLGMSKKGKDAQTPSRSKFDPDSSEVKTPSSGKASIKEWLIKEIANSYSPST